MKFHGICEDLLGSREKVRILETIVGNSDKVLNSSEIAKKSNVSIRGTIDILEFFFGYGIIRKTIDGQRILWRPNKKNILYSRLIKKSIINEAEFKNELVKDLRNHLKKTTISEAILFGSIQKAMERSTSDIDILLVGSDSKKTKNCLRELRDKIFEKYGNLPSFIFLSNEQFRDMSGSAQSNLLGNSMPLL